MLLSLPTDIIRYIRDFAWIPQVCRELKKDLEIKHGLETISILDKYPMPHQYQYYFGPRTKMIKYHPRENDNEKFKIMMRHIHRCTGLKHLDFSNTYKYHFTDTLFLQQFKTLEYLNIGNFYRGRDVVVDFSKFNHLVYLKYLNVSRSNIRNLACLQPKCHTFDYE